MCSTIIIENEMKLLSLINIPALLYTKIIPSIIVGKVAKSQW